PPPSRGTLTPKQGRDKERRHSDGFLSGHLCGFVGEAFFDVRCGSEGYKAIISKASVSGQDVGDAFAFHEHEARAIYQVDVATISELEAAENLLWSFSS
ncbi:MAG TPA: hypothetical protein PKO06_21560, partial [Candidatus Ozemobacteraceae bacterium]|nr:hypothetical protein [Candidatus Ozemobacteraceae bacterium]